MPFGPRMARARAVLPVVALAVVLAGCGGALPSPGDGSAGATPPDATPGEPSAASVLNATVTEVVDGDTVDVRYPNGTLDTVRLLGVDAPETVAENRPGEFEGVPDTTAGRRCLREAGGEATRFARSRLAGESVTLVLDAEADRRGAYGRLLAYVYARGENLNYRLVERGHARVYDSPFSLSAPFYDAEAAARRAARGLWRCRSAGAGGSPTRTGDAGGAGLVVAAIHADAPGNDHENPNGEYVAFRNEGDGAVDLSRWTVRDAAGHAYTFPDGVALGAGETVALYTGPGEDARGERHWGADGAVWNNGGDVITLLDREGTVVLRRAYGEATVRPASDPGRPGVAPGLAR